MTGKWDYRFYRMAMEVRKWVKGPSLGVGAVIISPNRRPVSFGYSGLPAGLEDTEERLADGEFRDKFTVHAEMNALLSAEVSVQGCSLYVTKAPCTACASAMLQKGIARVISPQPEPESRWHRDQVLAALALKEAGVEVKYVRPRGGNLDSSTG